jgi:hypothetical protein
MSSDDAITSAINSSSQQSLNANFAVGTLRKARDDQRLEGEAAVRLIDATAPQMTKTPDGHISVYA